MQTPTGALLVVAVLFAQGCSVERTDLSPVYEKSATRSEIEAVLGEPVASRVIEEGHISIYQYNTGRAVGMSKTTESWFEFLTYYTMIGGLPLAIAADSTPQKGLLAVFYSADDDPTNVHLSGSGDPDTEMDRLAAGLDLKRRAEEGDIEAMYRYGFIPGDLETRWLWHCPAAHLGHATAQYEVGNYYRWGWAGIERSSVKAFAWYRLAESNGYEGGKYTGEPVKTEGGPKCCWTPFSEVLAADMTPSELADGERLVSNWKPNPAQCEGEAKLAAD